MKALRFKVLTSICLWIFLVQGMAAFTPNAVSGSVDSGFYYSQSSIPKQFYHEISIFKIEHAPQDEISFLPFSLISKSLLSSEEAVLVISSKEYSYRDQKYGLKILVFPFHSFW